MKLLHGKKLTSDVGVSNCFITFFKKHSQIQNAKKIINIDLESQLAVLATQYEDSTLRTYLERPEFGNSLQTYK